MGLWLISSSLLGAFFLSLQKINSREMEMIFITTLIESALVLILLAIPFVATQLIRRKKKRNGLVWKKQTLTGVEAKAVILAIEQTGLYIDHQPQVKMQMQVIPERGRNFIAETSEVLSVFDMATIRAGSTVKVKYNPENIREISLIKP
jgi:hypothetical protein